MAHHARLGLAIDAETCRTGDGDPLELDLAVDAILHAAAATGLGGSRRRAGRAEFETLSYTARGSDHELPSFLDTG